MWGLLGSREFAAARTEGWLQYHGWLQTETPTTDANAMWTWCNLHMEHMKTTIKQPTSRIWIVHTLKTLVGWSFLHGWLTSINWGSWGHNCRIFSFSTSPVPGVPGSKAWIVLHKVVPTPLDQQMLKTTRLDVSKSGRWQVRMGKLPNESPMFHHKLRNYDHWIIQHMPYMPYLEETKPRRTGFPKIVHPKVGPWVPSWEKTME